MFTDSWDKKWIGQDFEFKDVTGLKFPGTLKDYGVFYADILTTAKGSDKKVVFRVNPENLLSIRPLVEGKGGVVGKLGELFGGIFGNEEEVNEGDGDD